MTRILDYKSWQDYNKFTKERTWQGWIQIDTLYSSDDELEERVALCYKLNKQRWQKVLDKLNISDSTEVPSDLRDQLNAKLAGDLREIHGRDRVDGRPVVPTKRLDMIKLAHKLGITPGDNGWEQATLDAVREDKV